MRNADESGALCLPDACCCEGACAHGDLLVPLMVLHGVTAVPPGDPYGPFRVSERHGRAPILLG